MSSIGAFDQGVSEQQQHQRDPGRAKHAAVALAALMRDKLDVNINSNQLRLFLAVYWSRVSSLAHTIHDNDE